MEIALMTSKLKEAEPTMVEAPSSPGHLPRLVHVSKTARRISGALEPRAMRVKLATVAFQKRTFLCLSFPSPSITVTMTYLAVIFSIASMKISATIEIPRKR